MASYDESRSRKLNRYAYISYVLQDTPGFRTDCHFVGLAGHDAGDLGVLMGHGVDPVCITMFDVHKSAIKDARWRFKDVPASTLVQKPVEQGIRHLPRVDSVYLDFGDTPDAGNMAVIKKVAQAKTIQKDCHLGISFTVGKENGNYEPELHALEKSVRREWDDVYAYFTLADTPYMTRALYVTNHVLSCRPVKGRFSLTRVWIYEARESTGRENAGGTPGVYLLTLAFKLVYGGIRYSPVQQVINAVRHPNFRLPGKEASSRYVGKLSCRLDGMGQDPALMLNITKGSVAAYRRLGKNGWYD